MNVFVVHGKGVIHGVFQMESEARNFADDLSEKGVTVSRCPFYRQHISEETTYDSDATLGSRFGGFRGR